MRIADILRNKGAAVATVTESTTVTGLLAELAVHNIGAMVVIGNGTGGQERSDAGNGTGGQERSDAGNGTGGQERSDAGNGTGGQERSDAGKGTGGGPGMVGIVSERDVVRCLHERGPGLLRRPVGEIMSDVAVTCRPGDPVDDLAALMTNNRVRHVPVLDGGRLVGIVSIGDVVKNRMEELQAERQQLQAYITGG
jgi:CBS domain-containing protein